MSLEQGFSNPLENLKIQLPLKTTETVFFLLFIYNSKISSVSFKVLESLKILNSLPPPFRYFTNFRPPAYSNRSRFRKTWSRDNKMKPCLKVFSKFLK